MVQQVRIRAPVANVGKPARTPLQQNVAASMRTFEIWKVSSQLHQDSRSQVSCFSKLTLQDSAVGPPAASPIRTLNMCVRFRAVTLNPDFGDAWAYWYKLEMQHGTDDTRKQVIQRCCDVSCCFSP
jgi:hypothetical protein